MSSAPGDVCTENSDLFDYVTESLIALLFLALFASPFKSKIAVLLFFIQLYQWFPSVIKAITIVRPETLVR